MNNILTPEVKRLTVRYTVIGGIFLVFVAAASFVDPHNLWTVITQL